MQLPLKPFAQKKRKSAAAFYIAIVIIVALIAAQLMFSLDYTRVYVIGTSMNPTLTGAKAEGVSGGDYVLIYDGTPDYGDIVVVTRESDGTEKTLIKRVIALGGDTVYLDHGALYIKYKGEDEFVLVEESYVSPENNLAVAPYGSYNTFPKTASGALDKNGHTVEEGYMFLLGDNRNVSSDSRSDYGDFALDELVGIVADWSITYKSLITGWYTFFDFTLRSLFS